MWVVGYCATFRVKEAVGLKRHTWGEITGNGHARKDWGAPAALAHVAPEVSAQSLGQGETPTGAPEGGFDAVEITDPVEREDPCAAFAKEEG